MPPRKKIIEVVIDEVAGTAEKMVKPRRKTLTTKQTRYLNKIKREIEVKGEIESGMSSMWGFDWPEIRLNFGGDVYYCWEDSEYPEPKMRNAEYWLQNHMPLLDMLLSIAYMHCIVNTRSIVGFIEEHRELFSQYFEMPEVPLNSIAVLERQRFALPKYLNALVLVYNESTQRYDVKTSSGYAPALSRNKVDILIHEGKFGTREQNWIRARSKVFRPVDKQLDAVWRSLLSVPLAKDKEPSTVFNYCFTNDIVGVMHLLASFYKVKQEIKPTLQFTKEEEGKLWADAEQEDFVSLGYDMDKYSYSDYDKCGQD